MISLLLPYALFIYSVPVSAFWVMYTIMSHEGRRPSGLELFIIPIILMIIVCVLSAENIKEAIRAARQSEYSSFKAVMVFKLCLIPFYIVNFICWVIAASVFHIAILALPLIPFVIAYTYATVLGTSAYNISNLLTLHRNNKITTKQFAVHCVLQLMFTADVIDSVYLAVNRSGAYRNTLTGVTGNDGVYPE